MDGKKDRRSSRRRASRRLAPVAGVRASRRIEPVLPLTDPSRRSRPACAACDAAAATAPPCPAPRHPAVLPPRPRRRAGRARGSSTQPCCSASAQVRFADAKARLDATQAVTSLTPITDAPVAGGLERRPRTATFAPADLEREAAEGARLRRRCRRRRRSPRATTRGRRRSRRGSTARRSSTLLRAPRPGAGVAAGRDRGPVPRAAAAGRARVARPGGGRAPPEVRAEARGAAGAAAARAGGAGARGEPGVGAQKLQTAISFGATLLGAFMGRKAVSVVHARPRDDGGARRRAGR